MVRKINYYISFISILSLIILSTCFFLSKNEDFAYYTKNIYYKYSSMPTSEIKIAMMQSFKNLSSNREAPIINSLLIKLRIKPPGTYGYLPLFKSEEIALEKAFDDNDKNKIKELIYHQYFNGPEGRIYSNKEAFKKAEKIRDSLEPKLLQALQINDTEEVNQLLDKLESDETLDTEHYSFISNDISQVEKLFLVAFYGHKTRTMEKLINQYYLLPFDFFNKNLILKNMMLDKDFKKNIGTFWILLAYLRKNNVNFQDEEGKDSLFYLVNISDKYDFSLIRKIFKQLLLNGLKLHLKDKSGKTALDYAIEKHYTKLVDLLRKHGAKTAKELGEKK